MVRVGMGGQGRERFRAVEATKGMTDSISSWAFSLPLEDMVRAKKQKEKLSQVCPLGIACWLGLQTQSEGDKEITKVTHFRF
jgi:hypothetical protein